MVIQASGGDDQSDLIKIDGDSGQNRFPEGGVGQCRFGFGKIGNNIVYIIIYAACCNVSYTLEELQSKLEIRGFTPTFAAVMQHPRLSKERRKEIKKIFKF